MRQQYECLECKHRMHGESPQLDGSSCYKCKGHIIPVVEKKPANGKEWYAANMLSILSSMDATEGFISDGITAHEAKVLQRKAELVDHLENKAFMIKEYNQWAVVNEMPLYARELKI